LPDKLYPRDRTRKIGQRVWAPAPKAPSGGAYKSRTCEVPRAYASYEVDSCEKSFAKKVVRVPNEGFEPPIQSRGTGYSPEVSQRFASHESRNGETRTRDLLLPKQAPWPLGYAPACDSRPSKLGLLPRRCYLGFRRVFRGIHCAVLKLRGGSGSLPR
jgi:hypothetical protein